MSGRKGLSAAVAAPMPLDAILPLLSARELALQATGADALQRWLAAPPARDWTAAEQAQLASVLPLYEGLLHVSNHKVNFSALRCMHLHLQLTQPAPIAPAGSGSGRGAAAAAAVSPAAALAHMSYPCQALKGGWVGPFTELLVEKLGDAHAHLRLAAHDCLLELHAVAGHGPVFDRLTRVLDAPPGHAHRAPSVRSGVFGIFLAMVAQFQSPHVLNTVAGSLRRFLEATIRGVADPAPSVRESALNVLVVLYEHVGDEVVARINAAPPSVLRPAHTRLALERLAETNPVPESARVSLSVLSPPVLTSRPWQGSVVPGGATGAAASAGAGGAAASASAALVKLKQQQTARRLTQGGRYGSSVDMSHTASAAGLGLDIPASSASDGGGAYHSPGRMAELSPTSTSSASSTSAAASPRHQQQHPPQPLSVSPDLKPILLYDARQLEQEMVKIAEVLRDATSAGWGERLAALRRFCALLLGGCAHFDNFPPLLRSLRDPLSAQVLDLRSSIVREACTSLALLARTLSPEVFEPHLDHFLNVLFKLLSVTIQVVKESANECVRALLISVPQAGNKALTKLLECSASPNAVLRLRCMEYVLLLLELGNTTLVDPRRLQNSLQQSLKLRLADKDSEVRHKARQALCAYQALSPAAAASWTEQNLDERTRKLVAEEKVKYEAARGLVSPTARSGTMGAASRARHSPDLDAGTPASVTSAASYSSGSAGGSKRRTHTRRMSSWSSEDEEKESAIEADEGGADTYSQPVHQHQPQHGRRDSGRMSSAGGGVGGPVRASHAHTSSLSMSAKRGSIGGSGSVLATPQQSSQHQRAKTMSATTGSGAGSTRRASGVFTFEAGATTPASSSATAAAAAAFATPAPAPGTGLASSQRLARSRSRSSATPAGLAQSTRSSSSVRSTSTTAAAAGGAFASFPAMSTPASSSGSRVRSASSVRASPSPNLHLGSLPLSPSQALLGHTGNGSSGRDSLSSTGGGSGVSSRRELLEEPLSHSQRSQLILSLLDQARDSLWSKRVHAFEQLGLIFSGGAAGPDLAGGDAQHQQQQPGKKVPEVFMHLDKLVLCVKAGLGDVHHRVVGAALQACAALLTPLPDPRAQLSEAELRPALERLLPDVFALLSHPKLPLRSQANQLLNHLSQSFPPELLCALLVHKVLDAVHTTSGGGAGGTMATHPAKVRLAILEFLHYLLPLSRSYFRTMTPVQDAGGVASAWAGEGAGGGGGSGGGQLFNAPLRSLLSRMAPFLSPEVDSSPASSKEPQLKRMCLTVCHTLYLGFNAPFLASLACLPLPTNRMVRRQLAETLPDIERRVAENQQQQQQQQQQQATMQQQPLPHQQRRQDEDASLDDQYDAQRDEDGYEEQRYEQEQEEEDEDHDSYEPSVAVPLAASRRAASTSAPALALVPTRHLDFNQAAAAAAAAAAASSAASIVTPREHELPAPYGSSDVTAAAAPAPAPVARGGYDEQAYPADQNEADEAAQDSRPRSRSAAWSKRMTAPAAMVSGAQGMYQPRAYSEYGHDDGSDRFTNGADPDHDADGDMDDRRSVRSAMLYPSHGRHRSEMRLQEAQQIDPDGPPPNQQQQRRHHQPPRRAMVHQSEFESESEPAPSASLDPSFLSSLLSTISSSHASWASRESAFVQLRSRALEPHTLWTAGQFESVLLALVDVVCEAEEQDPSVPGDHAQAQDPHAAAAIPAALGVLEAMLSTHSAQLGTSQGAGGGGRLLELLLRSMLQVMRSTPTASSSSSSAAAAAASSPRAAAAHALQSQAATVFGAACTLCPPAPLLRLLLHVLSTEQVHEGVLKVTLQRLATLVDHSLDKYTLLDSADSFGLERESEASALASAPPASAPLVECIVHALSLCTHSSVLVRKLVISAFVRLYARLRGDLLPFLDDLNPLLVKLVHIYINKFDVQQQQQQQQQQGTSNGGGRDVSAHGAALHGHARSSSTASSVSAAALSRAPLGRTSSNSYL